MEENVISGISGIGWYGVISIAIFFSFFTGMLAWAFMLKKSHVQSMGGLPLDGNEPDEPSQLDQP